MPRRTATVTADPIAELEKTINNRWPGAIMRASDPSLVVERIATGILSIDCMLGGGIARGRHTEIYSGYSVGKTYTTYKLIATAQALGLKCDFLDVEGTFDPVFAEHCGVDLERLSFPEHGQNANRLVNIMETLLRSELYDVIVLDSIAALTPKSEEDADMESGQYGTAQAKLMSQALRRLTTANKRTALVYINQTRQAIGVVFGKQTITSGGKAMAFYAGTRLEMVRTESIKRKGKTIHISKGDEQETDLVVGHRVLVRCEKDKTGGARQQAETTFVFSYDLGGADPIEDLLYLGRVHGLVKKSGNSWWAVDYEDEKQNGRNRFKRWLRRNVAVADELREQIIQRAKDGAAEESGEDSADE
jgi:recombination protein RecA